MLRRGNRKFQVFISSTYKDLTTERQAIIQAVLDAGHIPTGMEFFAAHNDTQLATLYHRIDESDLFILLFGGRYGTRDKTHDKSYTQLEYEYAIGSKKPCYSVVLSDEHLSSKGVEISEEDEYKNFKAAVMNRANEIASTEADIVRAVLKILNNFVRSNDIGGWVREEYAVKNLEENDHLTKIVEELQKKNQELSDKIYALESDRIGDYTLNELIEALESRNITNESGETQHLLDIFIKNFDILTAGFVLDEHIGQKLYGTLITFQSLGLLWIATSESPQKLRTSKNGRKFYAQVHLLGRGNITEA